MSDTVDWQAHAGLPTYGLEGADLDALDLVLLGARPAPLEVELPGDLRDAAVTSGLLLTDTEGTPLARLDSTGCTILAPAAHGPGRSWRRPAAAVAADGPSVAVAFRDVPRASDLIEAEALLTSSDVDRLLLVAVVGAGAPLGVRPEDLVRAVVAAAEATPGAEALVLPLPGPRQGSAGETDPAPPDAAWTDALVTTLLPYGVTTVVDATGSRMPDADAPLPAASAEALRRSRPTGPGRGAVVLLSGLSGSGKSTVARALSERIEDLSVRRVTLLDGDEVRRMLSAGLGFDRDSRELNVRRIGYVASLIAEHGGLVICAPIAPFAAARADMRARAEAVGDFILVHVSTPLEVCEARDRKGLYAKARAGLVPEFTGISSPYEEPTDADVVVDTTDLSIDAAVDLVLAELDRRGLLR